MKKVISLLSIIAFMLIMPLNVHAKETPMNIPAYGTLYVNETPWTSVTNTVTQVYSLTKAGKYVAIIIIPVKNLTNLRITASDNFNILKQEKGSDGSITVLLEAKNGTGVNGTKTELLTAVAEGTDKISLPESEGGGCNMSPSPISINCSTRNFDGYYFDNDGNSITEEEYKVACEGATPTTPPSDDQDIPNADTGSVVPYLAIGGGLIAIAGVYLYSRKTKKVYKI